MKTAPQKRMLPPSGPAELDQLRAEVGELMAHVKNHPQYSGNLMRSLVPSVISGLLSELAYDPFSRGGSHELQARKIVWKRVLAVLDAMASVTADFL